MRTSHRTLASTPASGGRSGPTQEVRSSLLQPEADRLRAALLRGESPESLGLTEDGLARVLEERGLA